MRKHAFELTPDSLDALDSSVQHFIKNVDIGLLEKERDRILLDLMKMKSNTTTIK